MAEDSRPARKRSQAVALGVVGSLAFALTSCSTHPDERCVDTTNYKTVADTYCNNAPGRGYSDSDRYQWYQSGGNSSYVHGYHRYYGSGSGSRVGSGGSEDGSGSGHGVSRGGFGGHSGSSGG